jgi:hypothetical protein
MFENIAIEDLDACINSEVQGWSIRGKVYVMAFMPQITTSQCH